jgi:hypothetical protein
MRAKAEERAPFYGFPPNDLNSCMKRLGKGLSSCALDISAKRPHPVIIVDETTGLKVAGTIPISSSFAKLLFL